MKTIICKFKSDGKDVKKTAIFGDCLLFLSKSKKNEATDILQPEELDNENAWAIFFAVTETLGYEVQFEYDLEENRQTFNPIKAITWDGSEPDKVTITDVQNVTVTVK